MIAKITRGTRPGDIAAYLHGPGKANEHAWTDELGTEHEGGIVIGGNLFREGDTRGVAWAQILREATAVRQDIRKPIWHVSLRNRAEDRVLSDAEWAAAAQRFAEEMGFAEHPWVAVRHGGDHIHLVTTRVRADGEVWHARGDSRAAQRAATALERELGLSEAPRTRATRRGSQRVVSAKHRRDADQLGTKREGVRQGREAVARANEGIAAGMHSAPNRQRQEQRLPQVRPRDTDRGR